MAWDCNKLNALLSAAGLGSGSIGANPNKVPVVPSTFTHYLAPDSTVIGVDWTAPPTQQQDHEAAGIVAAGQYVVVVPPSAPPFAGQVRNAAVQVASGITTGLRPHGMAQVRGGAVVDVTPPTVARGASAVIANDGKGNQLTLSVHADGTAWLQQTAGYTGFQVSLTFTAL